MKKITIAVLCLFMIGMTANAQLKFGLKGGLTLAKMEFEDDEGKNTKFNTGFHIGALVALDLPLGLEFETGLYLNQKGFKIEESFEGETFTMSIVPLYIDVPLKLNYKIEAGPAAIFFGAGPTISYGIGGKYKFEGMGEEESEDISWGNDEEEDDFKPLDLGIGIQLGVRFSKIQVSASYDMGLSNINTYEDFVIKNKPVIGVSAAFIF
jgi:hypothetical protein